MQANSETKEGRETTTTRTTAPDSGAPPDNQSRPRPKGKHAKRKARQRARQQALKAPPPPRRLPSQDVAHGKAGQQTCHTNEHNAEPETHSEHDVVETHRFLDKLPTFVELTDKQDLEFPDFSIPSDKVFDHAEKVSAFHASLPQWLVNPVTIDPDTELEHSSSLGIVPSLLKTLSFESWFPVQQLVIPRLISRGGVFRTGWRDCVISAPTGSGKSLCYGLPIIQNLMYRQEKVLRAVVLLPTVALVKQISGVLEKVASVTELVVSSTPSGWRADSHRADVMSVMTDDFEEGLELIRQWQLESVKRKSNTSTPDILVTTPLDFLTHAETGGLNISHLQYLVIDEADEVLRRHTKNDIIDRVLTVINEQCSTEMPGLNEVIGPGHSTSPSIQKILVTATLPTDPEILGQLHLRQPIHYAVAGRTLFRDASHEVFTLPSTLKHGYIVCNTDRAELKTKILILHEYLLEGKRFLCFVKNSKTGETVVRTLSRMLELSERIDISVALLAGTRSRITNQLILRRFEGNQISLLVTTDVASRGLDIPGLAMVVNLENPFSARSYVHRAGRTARRGHSGECITMITRPTRFRRIMAKLNVEAQNLTTPIMNRALKGPGGRLYKAALKSFKRPREGEVTE